MCEPRPVRSAYDKHLCFVKSINEPIVQIAEKLGTWLNQLFATRCMRSLNVMMQYTHTYTYINKAWMN